jgi:predicted homoserine dehydrogenase-like protein
VPHHLALGTYVVIEGDTEYARRCFKEYAMLPDRSGRYAALYRPIHMIGLELGVSIASAALRHEPTGAPTGFRSDVVAVAKRDLKKGEVLDGEGGFCVWGRQMPATLSLVGDCLPLGLAQNVKLTRDVAAGEQLKWSDTAYDASAFAVKVRREMEVAFAGMPDAAPGR